MAQITYEDIVASGAASLADDEYWCIMVEGKPLEQTASKDLTYPVRVICQAMDADWDDLRESGCSLGRMRKPSSATAD